MDIFSIMTLLGGLAFFLYGMNIMSVGLEKMTGGKLESALKRLTSNKFKSLLLGAGITIAIQSSSAMTVMLVGFVNSGIMEFGCTIGIIMGSNIGTTLTAWILSLTGIQGDSFFLRLLKPESFCPLIAFIGILLLCVAKKGKKKSIGNIMLGFSILMFGMTLMSDAVSPLADMPQFSQILVAFKNPIIGVLVGTLFTGIIQSSAASVGILQALSLTGNISYGMAIPIIMGQNIGTCVTALLSSIGVNRNAKRVAIVHIYFNIIGTVVCLSVFLLTNAIFHMPFVEYKVSPVAIAGIHTIFNVVTTMMLFPFTKQLEVLAKKTIPNKGEELTHSFIDERLLATPSVAIAECSENTTKMAKLVNSMVQISIGLLEKFDYSIYEQVKECENEIDRYEENLGSYLVKVSSKDISGSDSKEISKELHVIGDFERIGDHALNIANVGQEIAQKNIIFSEKASLEIQMMIDAINEIMDITFRAFFNKDVELAKQVGPLKEVIDGLKAELKDRHVERLKNGECTIEQGFILSDLLTELERTAHHCFNIAGCMIQLSASNSAARADVQKMKALEKGTVTELLIKSKGKYTLQ